MSPFPTPSYAQTNRRVKPGERRRHGRLHSRRTWLALVGTGLLSGCRTRPDGLSQGRLDRVWGRRGLADGRLQKPRAMAIDQNDQLYIVDMTARIQVFDVEGNYLRGWRTPTCENGRPSGLSIGRDGLVLVADTHYFRLLCYTSDGRLVENRTIGGIHGERPGEFGFVTDVVQDSLGDLYVSEYGEYDRIQKFSPDGQFILQWGGHGSKPGEFVRPQNLAIDQQDHIWVADACNHRIEVFDVRGKLLDCWGQLGNRPGLLCYPYDLALDGHGHVYVCEFGNHRVQKFTLDGRSLGCWGRDGRREGELHNPWALVCDHQGRIHVLDTNNHRVQRIVM